MKMTFAAPAATTREAQRVRREIEAGETCGCEERGAGPKFAQKSAKSRSQNKAEPERRTDKPEGPCSVIRRRHIGDESIRGNVHGASDASDGATKEEPADRGRKAHERVVEAEGEKRRENDGSPSESVAQVPDRRSADKLQTGVNDE
jgi:hypothetical protein